MRTIRAAGKVCALFNRVVKVVWSVAFSRGIVLLAMGTALVVGCVLLAINHGDGLLAGTIDVMRSTTMLLTFLVPYCVSAYSAAAVGRYAA